MTRKSPEEGDLDMEGDLMAASKAQRYKVDGAEGVCKINLTSSSAEVPADGAGEANDI